jgi:predicted outer membrane repeat protein
MKCCWLLLLGWFVAWPALAETYVVHPDGSGDFPTIRAALDAAVDGDVIELGDGVFTGAHNRNLYFDGKAITLKSQSGNPEACTIDCGGRSRAFNFVDDEGPGTVIRGIALINGEAYDGGAILCSSTSPTLENLILRYNTADLGGAIRCWDASPSVTGCLFEENTSSGLGGAIYCDAVSWPTFEDCFIRDNQSEYSGGGLCVLEAGVTLIDCEVVDNSASDGAGIYLGNALGELTGCTVAGNTATEHGGGGLVTVDVDLTITECTVVRNDAPGFGGGLGFMDSNIIMSYCTVAFNEAVISGGGIYCVDTDLEMTNTIIAFSVQGEGFSCWYCEPLLSCCDIYGNAGGDWTGPIEDQLGVNGNISEDPLFCGEDDYQIDAESSCAPYSPPNPECDLIGAWPVGCGYTRAQPVTWGRS